MRLQIGLFVALLVAGVCAPPVFAKIEAVQGKQYTLTKKHGPWMVMVAVFSEPPEAMKTAGMSPAQAAEALVFELRKQGIPAYSFKRDQQFGSVETLNRLQQVEKRRYKTKAEFCVLAGNYASPEAKQGLAKRTLAWIKDYYPESLQEGGIYKPTPGQPSLLSGAFLTINPMLDPNAVKQEQRKPEIVRFNSHYKYSLLKNEGKYTVTVASFYPNSITQIGSKSSANENLNNDRFEETIQQAWQVTQELRETYNLEAYVFHDHDKSIVTIGSFDSPNDPGIQKVREEIGAEIKRDPVTGQTQILGQNMVLADKQGGQWMCTFDPRPAVIEVPYKD